jgi:predicted enzyme related to lactoylglutathione lyase
MPVYIQHIADGASRVHLDLESDDVVAEVARLTRLGASVVAHYQSESVGDWTVLRDPAGVLFCVVTADKDDRLFAEQAKEVE